MAKYTSRADLLIAAGESIKMQEKAGKSIPVVKFEGHVYAISNLALDNRPEDYEFPLAVVEGKPVFVGDELWNKLNNHKFTVNEMTESLKRMCSWENLTWLPPTPATVMVELTREDAEKMANQAQERLAESYAIDRVGLACRKALDAI